MEYRIVRGILFVSPGKEIDHFRAERIIRYTESLLRQQRFRTMVFDLADTVFMDSAGVGMMIGLYREIRAWGGAVFIIRMQNGDPSDLSDGRDCRGSFRVMTTNRSLWQPVEGGGKDNEG